MFHLRKAVLALAVVALSSAAAKPTFDTTDDSLVITYSNNEVTTDLSTTEDPNAPIQLTEMDVLSTISLRYAHTAVVTRVHNPAKRAQETTFRMLLPDTAFISGFTMTVDEKSYKAFVKKKEEAKQIYSEAVSRGYGAAHIAAKARDSNHFTVSMNVEPKSTVVFNLTYEELLVRRNGVYNHAINLHPGALVPKLQVTVHIKEAAKISTVRVPEIRTGNEIDADENAPQNGNAVIRRTQDDREAIITFTPDDDEQRRLIRVYAEKSRSRDENTGLLGQFVVQYDVDRSEAGEILVNDGYFVHFFAPTSLPPLPKHVVFVLDTSISMSGREIAQLQDAMRTILNTLNRGDHFTIIQFNTGVKVLEWADPNGSWRQYDLGSFSRTIVLEATPENIAKAQNIISTLRAGGVTNIAQALDFAVDIAQKVAENNSNAENTVAAENNKLEPIIIFLTDGQPTTGETDPTVIINRINEHNVGENKASIFSIAFGSDPDRNFLRKLSLRNSGFMRHIYMAGDAALQLQDFYRSVSSPLLADVQFKYPKEQIKEGSLTKNKFRAYYAGSETVVAGRVADGAVELAPHVVAICKISNGPGRQPYEMLPKVPIVHNEDYFPLERIWAYLTIKQLLDQKDTLIENDENKSKAEDLKKSALDIALQYEFVTPLTSLVVVKPNDTRAVEVKPADDHDSSYIPDIAPYSGIPRQRISSINYNSFPQRTSFRSSPSQRVYGGFSYDDNLSDLSSSSRIIGGDDSPMLSSIFGFPGQLDPDDRFMMRSSDYFDPRISGDSDMISYHMLSAPPMNPRLRNRMWLHRGYGGFRRPMVIFTSTAEPSTTSEPSTTTVEPSTTTLEPSTTSEDPSTTTELNAPKDPLEPYCLKEFPWALSLLDAANDSLILHVNGTQVNLKLTKDISAAPADGAACAAAGGGAARCTYLPRCGAAHALSADLYRTEYCVLDDGYAGVCCPVSKEDAHVS